MVFTRSRVSVEESERVKKRLYIESIDEYNGGSKPLNDIVLSTYLDAVPAKRSRQKLKPGYIVDITREGGVSPCSIILGLLYIKRLSLTNPQFFHNLSSRELFLVSMLVASKYLNDEGELEALTNTDFSTIGSIPRTRLDHLEMKFLDAIDWKLFVSVQEYYQFVSSIEGRVAINEACTRGWFSYTDLAAIWEATDSYSTMFSATKTTAKVTCGSALLYLVCVATLFSSQPRPDPLATPTTLSANLNDTPTFPVFEHAHSSADHTPRFDPSSDLVNMNFPNMANDEWNVTNNRPPGSIYSYRLGDNFPPGHILTVSDDINFDRGPKQKNCLFCRHRTSLFRKTGFDRKTDFVIKEKFPPVVTVETVTMVTPPLLFDTGQSVIEKNNFTMFDIIGLLAQSVLVW